MAQQFGDIEGTPVVCKKGKDGKFNCRPVRTARNVGKRNCKAWGETWRKAHTRTSKDGVVTKVPRKKVRVCKTYGESDIKVLDQPSQKRVAIGRKLAKTPAAKQQQKRFKAAAKACKGQGKNFRSCMSTKASK